MDNNSVPEETQPPQQVAPFDLPGHYWVEDESVPRECLFRGFKDAASRAQVICMTCNCSRCSPQ
jgi:hypothetical protein